jgi:hypothetical protein
MALKPKNLQSLLVSGSDISCVLIMFHPYPRCWLKLALTYIFRCLSDQPRFILINCFARVQHRCRHSNTSGHQVAETIMSYDADIAWYITHVPMLPASPTYHLYQPRSRGDLCSFHRFLRVLFPTQADWTPLGECWVSWWVPLNFDGQGRSAAAWCGQYADGSDSMSGSMPGDRLFSAPVLHGHLFQGASELSLVGGKLVGWCSIPIWDGPHWLSSWGETGETAQIWFDHVSFWSNLDGKGESPEFCGMVLAHDT